jgi:3-methyladenine DNA glycosylase AlkD
MAVSKLGAELGREFERRADPKYRESLQRFFREPVELAGVPMPVFREVEREYYQRVRDLTKTELFKLCEELLAVGRMEETSTAFAWAWRRRRELEPSDFRMFERWMKQHVSNWGACDTLCCRALGDLLARFPALAPKVLVWTGSKGRWVKRASAVALIPGMKQGLFFD